MYGMEDNDLWTKDQTGDVSSINLGEIKSLVPYLLSATSINATVKTTNLLYTVPAGKRLIIRDIIMRSTTVSPNPTTRKWQYSIGGIAPFYQDYVNNFKSYLINELYTEHTTLPTNTQTPCYAAGTAINLITEVNSEAVSMFVTVYLFGELF